MGRKTSEEAMQKVRASAGMFSKGPGPAPLSGARPKYSERNQPLIPFPSLLPILLHGFGADNGHLLQKNFKNVNGIQ